MDCIRSESISPNLAVRTLTLFSLSVHDSINLLDKRYHTYQSYEKAPLSQWDQNAIVAGCGWHLGKTLHPAKIGIFDALAQNEIEAAEKTITKKSFDFGISIAQELLSLRQDDGTTTTVTYFPTTKPGKWRRTPNLFKPPEQPHWRKVAPFSIPSVNQFIPPPPPDPESDEFIKAIREVKEIGGKMSQLRNPTQSFLAKFWKDFKYSQTPPGHWNDIAEFVGQEKGFDLWQEARMFALLNMALSDAGIVAWECKFRYQLWRPVHAIRFAKQFPRTAKLADPQWEPLIETPSHPEYVSAHSCFSGAAAEVLRTVAGADSIAFRVKSDEYPGKVRKFSSFSECLSEISDSRLHGGIHYRFSNEIGMSTGEKIGAYCCNHSLKPLK